MPELLGKGWHDNFYRFIQNYPIDASQQDHARQSVDEEKDQTVHWLTVKPGSIAWLLFGMWTDFERVPFKRSYPGGGYEVNIAVADRVEEYRHKVEELRGLQGPNSSMGKDVEK